MTRTAEMADVVLPGTASWCEAEGTVTNSERRVQRVRKALDAPATPATTSGSSRSSRGGSGTTGNPTAEEVWDELRSLSPMHRGMRYDRLGRAAGDPVALPRRGTPDRCSSTGASGPSRSRAARSVQHRRGAAAVRGLDADYPIRLTTGRRLESFNTGVQSGRYRSPLHRGESLDLSPEDAERLELSRERWCASRRGALGRGAGTDRCLAARRARVHDPALPDEVDVTSSRSMQPIRSPVLPSSRPRPSGSSFEQAPLSLETHAGEPVDAIL